MNGVLCPWQVARLLEMADILANLASIPETYARRGICPQIPVSSGITLAENGASAADRQDLNSSATGREFDRHWHVFHAVMWCARRGFGLLLPDRWQLPLLRKLATSEAGRFKRTRRRAVVDCQKTARGS